MFNIILKLFLRILKPGILFLLFFNISLKTASAGSCMAIISNNWNQASTWSCGQVPVCGDTIIIPAGLTVTINLTQQDYTACIPPNIIQIYGTLKFLNGFKLRLNCTSVINLYAGGSVEPGTGSGNSNYIEICNDIVWNAADGSLYGPVTLPNPLPVSLVSFTAKAGSKDCILQWTTASEINNQYFAPERSKDGKIFEETGRVAGAGNSTSLNNYSLTDASPFTGISYYRLKQVDYDGTTTYSKIVAVDFRSRGFESVNAYVDYNNQSINASIKTGFTGKATYRLSDVLGNNLVSGPIQSSEGNYNLSIPAHQLAKGIYYFTIQYEGEKITRKIFY
jgi:hypothetical protein